VANSKRRDDDAVDDRLDDVLDEDALSEELDEATDEFADDEDDDADDKSARSNGRTRTLSRPSTATGGKKATRTKEGERPGVFARLANFVREVVAELRKVIWPTRKELLTYTAVVIVFVTIMFSIVSGLDVGFGKLMFLVFGHGTSVK
jgi:preprotein translocase subunit SecE